MQAVFLDFDGVIVDSIHECYLLCKNICFGFSKPGVEDDLYKKLFYQFRGLAKPAYEFLPLHQALEESLRGSELPLPDLFQQKKACLADAQRDRFEDQFFSLRRYYQRDLSKWLAMNPLTEYGKILRGKKLENYFIVTTKNRESVEFLLSHHRIEIEGIYDREDYRRLGDKGSMIEEILDHRAFSEAIFVDDVVGHLNTVRDFRVKCYFADWGYGKNTAYPIYQKQLWGCVDVY